MPDIKMKTANNAATDINNTEQISLTGSFIHFSSDVVAEIKHWLDWQCHMITDVNCGGVFVTAKIAGDPPKMVALWPDAKRIAPNLQFIAEKTIKEGRQVAQKESNSDAQVLDYIAHPIFQNDRVVGAVVFALAIRSEQQHQAVMQLLQWGILFIERIVERSQMQRQQVAAVALNAVALFTPKDPLAVCGYHLCNLLADSFNCSRVILGLRRGLQIRVLSMSHQLQFDRRLERVNQIEFAMEECLEQNQTITLPDSVEGSHEIIKIHAQHLLNDDNGSVCSIALHNGETSIGVITLLCDKSDQFDDSTVKMLTTIIASVTPIISLHISNSQSIWRKSLSRIGKQVQRLIGAGHLRFKYFVATSIIVFALLTLVQTDHLITAQATVEGEIQQAIVAPFNSYIASTNARAGDLIEQGQVLATLDNRDLLLEQEKWLSEREKLKKEYLQALASRDRSQVSILTARIAQTNAQLNNVEEQLQHTQLRAPFSGLLVSGDWSRALGTPIERGQLMFEVVPDKNFRIALQVDEHDMADVILGQNGHLRLTGLPEQFIQLRVSHIIPIASVQQGSNNFRVESAIVDAPQGLRPGMQGIAKIVIGRDSLLNVWTDSLFNRVRLWIWSQGF